MPGLLSQTSGLKRVDDISAAANRSLAQFKNSFDSVIADLSAFEAERSQYGFDADTDGEVNGLRDALLQQAAADVQARLDQLNALLSG